MMMSLILRLVNSMLATELEYTIEEETIQEYKPPGL